MPKVTIGFGLLLCGLSAAVFLLKPGITSYTWLIPSVVGLPLILLGLVATMNAASKKHVMHAAVTLALLGGLLALGRGVSQIVQWMVSGKEILPLAAGMIWAMTVLCFAFVGLCVRSFIAARRAREI